jgi:hypothetical protein
MSLDISFDRRPPLRLDDAQVRRYSRQILLDAVGGRGQRALLGGAVAVPLDGAAEPRAAALVVLAYLAGAGVGTLALIGEWDAPVTAPELGLLLEAEDLGQPRGPAIARRIAERTPDVRVVATPPDGAVWLRLDEPDPPGGIDEDDGPFSDSAPAEIFDEGAPLGSPLGEAARSARALWRGGRAATRAIAALLEPR